MSQADTTLMWQQLVDFTRPLRRQPDQHISQISIRIMAVPARRLDQTHDRRRPSTAAKRSGKQPIGASKCPKSDLIFDWIIVDR